MISTRTPEGLPHRCTICGETSYLEPSFPGGDTVCPACGGLLKSCRDYVSRLFRVRIEEIKPDTPIRGGIVADSLEFIEFILDLEHVFGTDIPDDNYEDLRTIGDVIRWFRAQSSA